MAVVVVGGVRSLFGPILCYYIFCVEKRTNLQTLFGMIWTQLKFVCAIWPQSPCFQAMLCSKTHKLCLNLAELFK